MAPERHRRTPGRRHVPSVRTVAGSAALGAVGPAVVLYLVIQRRTVRRLTLRFGRVAAILSAEWRRWK